jgi:hypothetical protein
MATEDDICVGVNGRGKVILRFGPNFSCSIGADMARWIAQDLNLAAYRAEVVRGVADAASMPLSGRNDD